jgi:hypothetical protein
MGKLGLVLNGVLLAGVLTVMLVGSEGAAAPVVQNRDEGLSALEAEVAVEPNAENLSALASTYLDHQQPGLAQAVLDQNAAVDAASVTHVRSRVALAQGRVGEALYLSELTVKKCDLEGCAPKTVARALRQTELLRAMSEAGISDPNLDPVGTDLAVARSGRGVQLEQP